MPMESFGRYCSSGKFVGLIAAGHCITTKRFGNPEQIAPAVGGLLTRSTVSVTAERPERM